jgi:hypothetical protein
MKLTASKWKVAALTLVTLPMTIWFFAENPGLPISKFMFVLGFLPLYIGGRHGTAKSVEGRVGEVAQPQVSRRGSSDR